MTALHIAVKSENVDAVRILLAHSGIDVNKISIFKFYNLYNL